MSAASANGLTLAGRLNNEPADECFQQGKGARRGTLAAAMIMPMPGT